VSKNETSANQFSYCLTNSWLHKFTTNYTRLNVKRDCLYTQLLLLLYMMPAITEGTR